RPAARGPAVSKARAAGGRRPATARDRSPATERRAPDRSAARMSAKAVGHLLEMPLEEGGCVHVEVLGEAPEASGLVPAPRRPALDTAAAAELSFEQALDRVRPAADALIARLRTPAPRPGDAAVASAQRVT